MRLFFTRDPPRLGDREPVACRRAGAGLHAVSVSDDPGEVLTGPGFAAISRAGISGRTSAPMQKSTTSTWIRRGSIKAYDPSLIVIDNTGTGPAGSTGLQIVNRIHPSLTTPSYVGAPGRGTALRARQLVLE